MSIFSRVCDSKAEDPFNCALFECQKFMKGHTGSTLPRTKYVKCFSPGASALRQAVISYCYRLVPRLKFIVIKRKVILSNVKQKCGPLPLGSAVDLNKLNLIEIELFIKCFMESGLLYNPKMKQTNLCAGCRSALQPGTIARRRSEIF